MGLGVAIVEVDYSLGFLPVEGVRVIPLSFHIPFQWGFVTAAGRPVIFEWRQLVATARRLVADIPQAIIYDRISQIQSFD